MANNQLPTNDHHTVLNPITTTLSFRNAVLALENTPATFEISSFFEKVKNYVEYVIGPKKSDENPDAYKVRVFAELMEQSISGNVDCPSIVLSHRDILVYIIEAMESGNLKTATRWCTQIIVDTKSEDPNYWVLYGILCARQNDLESFMECAQKAIAIDGKHQIALFVRVAILMTSDAERFDAIESSLKFLGSVHPQFVEAHFLSALHYRRLEMTDLSCHFLSLANQFFDDVNQNFNNPILNGLPTVWESPSDYGRDPALKCTILLIKLQLLELATLCLQQAFTKRADPYHYLMAVLHHKRGEFLDSEDHLNSMADNNHDGRQLLVAHNYYCSGRTSEAVIWYTKLSFRPVDVRYGLAYSRLGDHFIDAGKYMEAANAFYQACSVTRTPALMTKLGKCLLASKMYAEAGKWLAEAVAVDGADNGDAWYYLTIANAKSGHGIMADICRQQAINLGFKSGIGPEYNLIKYFDME